MTETRGSENKDGEQERVQAASQFSRCIDWYSEGEEKVVEVDGIAVSVRFIGRKGSRGRIAITAPSGATFLAQETDATPDRTGDPKGQ